jgi:hypothetical protein
LIGPKELGWDIGDGLGARSRLIARFRSAAQVCSDDHESGETSEQRRERGGLGSSRLRV